MLKLYHYTPLVNLPSIMAEGLSLGNVAIESATEKGPVAVSLTTQSDPDSLLCWGESRPAISRTQVRLACRLSPDDPKLERAADTWKRLSVSRRFLDAFDSRGQRKWWFFYFGVIPATDLTIELRGRAGYAEPEPSILDRVVQIATQQRDNLDFDTRPGSSFGRGFQIRDREQFEMAFMTDDFPAEWLGPGSRAPKSD